jgi:hypothetical protein
VWKTGPKISDIHFFRLNPRNHHMSCPGMANPEDGKLLINTAFQRATQRTLAPGLGLYHNMVFHTDLEHYVKKAAGGIRWGSPLRPLGLGWWGEDADYFSSRILRLRKR